MAVILISSATIILLYTYFFYPLLIGALAKLRPRFSPTDESYIPRISIILSAYNEERQIEQCLDSLLCQSYPMENVEILIGSDGSSDNTNSILQKYSLDHRSVKPFFFEVRRGKIGVLNDLINQSTGDILFFVDADMTLSPYSLTKHVRHYVSQEVGGVAGIYRIIGVPDSGVFESENDYHSYEMWLRKNESLIHSTVGLSGGNYSLRKKLWRELPSDFIHDDLFSVFTLLQSGKRLLFEPLAISTEHFVRSIGEEFHRKARFASRGFETVKYFPKLLAPQAGMTAIMIWSHKILRWIAPFLFLTIFIATVAGSIHGYFLFFSILIVLELAGITAALIGFIFNAMNISMPVFRHAFWFVAMNLAFMVGAFRFIFRLDKEHWAIATRASLVNQIAHKEEASL